ncbi:hypothetical protein KDW_35460 [Dictyobacter vulcani]|uniref:Uncharacterized protein n=1 Tax=Dictyobacter vulcani TaxID=2607529 RepID=A0A5J4KIS6_9CHLR|nr:helicase-associated domain-containing protein [Dictyobacter vulcani]GER89384.1 hypothetical protein KDW_35460 [Dictyobacter vulcani]
MNPGNPLIVQSDRSILLEVDHPLHDEARDALAQFAELEKSPEHIHTYRLTPLSLWNAAAGGMDAPAILELLTSYSKYPLPANITAEIQTYVHRYGRVKLIREGDDLLLYSDDHALMTEIVNHKKMQPYIQQHINRNTIKIDASRRGHVKQALIHIGFPAEDLAGYTEGSPLPLQMRSVTLQGKDFEPRQYQQSAVSTFYAGGAPSGGSGVVVLPCGAGKTIVGIATIATLQRATLILTPTPSRSVNGYMKSWTRQISPRNDWRIYR